MLPFIILFVVIAVLLGIIFFKILKTSLQAVLSVAAILIVGSLIFSFFLYQDARSFQDRFQEESTLYLLEDEGEFIAGFELLGTNFSTFEIVDNLSEEFTLDTERVILVFSRDAFNETNRSIALDGEVISFTDVDSEDQTIRSISFMAGVASLLEQDASLRGVVSLLRDEKVMVYPDTFLVRTLTFQRSEYRSFLRDMYERGLAEVRS